MISINPQYFTLSQLIAGRLFRIPDYQRAYSWTSGERSDLFSDIRKTHKKGPDAGHFMATIVCLARDTQRLGTDNYQVVEVVDGQQRLTTLIILLKAVSLASFNPNKLQKRISNEIGDLLVKAEGDELLLLQTNHDSSHYFDKYIRRGVKAPVTKAKTIADRELLAAFSECQEFVAKWQETEGEISDLFGLLKNQLYFLFHTIEEESTVYSVFEVLNSRGLEVNWIDRLKSMLMGDAFDQKDVATDVLVGDLHTKWRDIYAAIGLRQGMSAEALRFAATLRSEKTPSRTIGEKESVGLLRSQANNAKGIRDVSSWLLDVVHAYDELVANPRIDAVTRISQARLLAVAIHLRNDLGFTDKSRLLEQWERVTFRIYGMMRKDARTRVGEFVRLAWRIINERLSNVEIASGLSEIGEDFGIDDAISHLRGANCYEGWERELRYFMFRYEESLSRERKQKFRNEQWERIWLASPSDSIEHIIPQSASSNPRVQHIGNLVLLPPRLNSSLQNKSPKLKADSYEKTGLLIAGEVASSIAKSGWKFVDVNARSEALLKWAQNEWAN